MGRGPCCSKEGMNKGAWTPHEDKILTDYMKAHGEGKWRNIPKEAGLKRCGKSCRLRWLNYLRPDIKRGNISHDEEDLIIRLHKLLGNKWSLIAGRLPGRTDNEIKNYWNTNLSKKAQGKETKHSTNEKKPIIKPPINNGTTVAINGPSMDCKLVKNVAEKSKSSDETSPEFTKDFNMGEICLPEILDSGFNTKLNDFVHIHDFNNVKEGDVTSHGCSQMAGDWRGSSGYVQAHDMDSDFLCLASLLESADYEWLGDDLDIAYPN